MIFNEILLVMDGESAVASHLAFAVVRGKLLFPQYHSELILRYLNQNCSSKLLS